MPGIASAVLIALLVLLPTALAAVVCLIAWRRIRTEPRRLGNAYWLLGAALLLGNVVATLGMAPSNPVFGAFVVVLVFSPLLALVLAGFLVLNGVVMLRRERARLGNLLSLLLGLGILGLLVAGVPTVLGAPTWLRALWLAAALAAGYLAFQFAAFLGYSWLYGRLTATRPADWVVVLGSGLLPGGRVPPLLASRVRTGIAESARRGARALVLSGGKGDDETEAEAEAMARWAVDNGADPALVRTETESRTTEQNLRLTGRLVAADPGTAGRPGLVVTSNYHVFRAAVLARRVGLDAQVVGAPTAGYYWPSAVIREFVAMLNDHRVTHGVLLALVALPLPVVLLLVADA